MAEYTAPSIINEPLMTVEKNPWTNIDELILTPYYKEARVEDVNGNTYILTRTGWPYSLYRKDITYTFDNDYSLIKATDGSTIYEVEQKDNELVLIGEDDTEHVFFIDYNFDLFSIEDNPHGAQDIKVADYYDSIFLRDNTGRLYRIIKDQLNRITITDERENTYDIRIQDNEIIAVKGSQSYSVKVAPNHIEINGLTLDFVTPYYIDPATGIITGHRVRVITRNEIEIIVPEKQIAGFYDVTK